jgi:hypothetical protein
MKWLTTLTLIIMVTALVGAFEYSDSTLPKLEREVTAGTEIVTGTNYSINTNRSDYWDDNDYFNTTQTDTIGSILTISLTWLNSWLDNTLGDYDETIRTTEEIIATHFVGDGSKLWNVNASGNETWLQFNSNGTLNATYYMAYDTENRTQFIRSARFQTSDDYQEGYELWFVGKEVNQTQTPLDFLIQTGDNKNVDTGTDYSTPSGDITIETGAGGTCSLVNDYKCQGDSGDITIVTGHSGENWEPTHSTPHGANAGDINLNTGDAKEVTGSDASNQYGGSGGDIISVLGQGGDVDGGGNFGGTQYGGRGGGYYFTSGAGGDSYVATDPEVADGGDAGLLSFTGGTGGAGTTTKNNNNVYSGIGGTLNLFGGLGGRTIGSSAFNQNLYSGDGGSINLTGGVGGLATTYASGNARGGDGGNVILDGGLYGDAIDLGSGNEIEGKNGNLIFKIAGTLKGILNGTTSYWGFGTSEPTSFFNILQSSGSQLRLSHSASNYTDFTTDSLGNLIINSTNNMVGINTVPSYPLHVTGDNGNITAYFEKNISAGGYITHTPIYDTTKGEALEFIKSAEEHIDENGKPIHSTYYGFVENEVEICVNSETITETEKVCKIVQEREVIVKRNLLGQITNVTLTDNLINVTRCYNNVIETEVCTETETIVEEGVLVDDYISMLEQAIKELKDENTNITARLNALESEK